MKRVLFLFAALTVFSFSQSAYALIFVDSLFFTGATQTSLNYNYREVVDSEGFSWTHSILDDLNGNNLNDIVLDDAKVRVKYAKTEGVENWSLKDLGNLSVTIETPIISEFALSSLSGLSSTGTFSVIPQESSTGRDTFRLIESHLIGNYHLNESSAPAVVTPEPVTGLMVLGGLLGYGMRRRRKKQAF
jgi:hypothetical protein